MVPKWMWDVQTVIFWVPFVMFGIPLFLGQNGLVRIENRHIATAVRKYKSTDQDAPEERRVSVACFFENGSTFNM